MILTPGGEVAAVVDWELCTLGDPLADVGTADGLLARARRAAARRSASRPTSRPASPAARSSPARYAERSGRDLSELDFYLALGYWKLAIILEGVYARYAAGGYGEVDEGIHALQAAGRAPGRGGRARPSDAAQPECRNSRGDRGGL